MNYKFKANCLTLSITFLFGTIRDDMYASGVKEKHAIATYSSEYEDVFSSSSLEQQDELPNEVHALVNTHEVTMPSETPQNINNKRGFNTELKEKKALLDKGLPLNETITALLDKGFSATKIAARLGLNVQNVRTFKRNSYVPTQTINKIKALSAEENERITALLDKGFGPTKIATGLGLNVQNVRAFMWRLDTHPILHPHPIPHPHPSTINFSAEEYKNITALLDQGLPLSKIAKKLRLNVHKVRAFKKGPYTPGHPNARKRKQRDSSTQIDQTKRTRLSNNSQNNGVHNFGDDWYKTLLNGVGNEEDPVSALLNNNPGGTNNQSDLDDCDPGNNQSQTINKIKALSAEENETITALLDQGLPLSKIAKKLRLNVHKVRAFKKGPYTPGHPNARKRKQRDSSTQIDQTKRTRLSNNSQNNGVHNFGDDWYKTLLNGVGNEEDPVSALLNNNPGGTNNQSDLDDCDPGNNQSFLPNVDSALEDEVLNFEDLDFEGWDF